MTSSHTDIKALPKLLRMLPERLHPYAYLARLDRPIGVWLLLLPGWWAIMLAIGGITNVTPRSLYIMALFAIGALLMRAAGCTINDLWDRDLDKQVTRTAGRPLASGALSVKQALIFLGLLLSVSFLILIQLGWPAIGLGLASVVLVVAYPLMKRITWWPQAFLGFTFNFGALIGWAAMSGAVPMEAVILYLGGLCWTIGYDTVYAHQDIEDDQMVGIKSTARLFGRHSKKAVALFYALSFSLICLAAFMAGHDYVLHLTVPLAGAHMVWQILKWDMDDPHSSLKIFKSNRDFGLLIFIAFALFGV